MASPSLTRNEPSQPQVILSGFADEAANQRTAVQQCTAFAAAGLQYLSIRFVDVGHGIKNAMQLSPSEQRALQTLLEEYGLKVSSLGSPLGKVKLYDLDDGTNNRFEPFDRYLSETVARACELACQLETKLVRGFSFYPPRGESPAPHLEPAADRLRAIVERCAADGLTYGLEVEANLVGRTGRTCAKLAELVDHPALVTIFDGGNLISQGLTTEQVWNEYLAMRPSLGWLHIKDFRYPAGATPGGHVDEAALKHFVPVEEGDSGHAAIFADLSMVLPEIAQRMRKRGVPGVFCDLEPHLKGGGQFGGFSGPDGFGVALRSLCRMLDRAGIAYHLRDFNDILAARGF
jgi:sugar phosphate isomerase/epimerase